MKLTDALMTNNTTTQNGMVTNSSTLNFCVDLFFTIGSKRGQDSLVLINQFVKAYEEDALTAMRILFWVRDIRGGAGERQIFRDIIKYLANTRTETMKKNIKFVPEFGRWDDLLVFIGTKLENDALSIIKDNINDSLVSKWMPRPNTNNKEKKRHANVIRKFLGLTPGDYRRLLSKNSNTVEQLMCNRDFGSINYSHVPSNAMSNYMKSFTNNDKERFSSYLASIKNGEVKINTNTLYPYDVVKNLSYGNQEGADIQWNNLPNYLEDNQERVLPVVDVSGSMDCSAGNSKTVTCMDVAVSLGLYISERNEGPFKDSFITFTNEPELQILKGSLSERYRQLIKADWGMSTNIEKVFTTILDFALMNNVPQEEMPTMIVILSDMEFNQASGDNWNKSAQEVFETLYKDSGYVLPKIVYWNLHAKNSNFPVKSDKSGTALISGFSPTILTTLLKGEDLSPHKLMMNVVNSERYTVVTV